MNDVAGFDSSVLEFSGKIRYGWEILEVLIT
jgi:hypothetical protein